ncbi:MAG: hypothetical protein QXU18_10385 [Thermoplasmatales archaeon]
MLSNIWRDSNIARNSGVDSIEILKEIGIIGSRIDNSKYPPRTMLFLTEKGKLVAQKLKEIEEILKG